MNLSDRYLLIQIKRGNSKAFEKLFHSLYSPLCLYVTKIVSSHEVAEEVVQDLFFHFWKNRNTITIKTSIKAYLFKSATNRALHYIEHQKVENRYLNFARTQEMYGHTPEESLIEKEYQEQFEHALKELPKQCQSIFRLSRYDHLKNREIAEKLSISIKTVEYNISKALNHFKQQFGPITE